MVRNASKNIRNFNVNVGAGLKPAFIFMPFPLRGKVARGRMRVGFFFLCFMLLLTACGSKGNDALQEDVATPITKEITPEDMIMSDRYLGELVVHFRDDLVVRLNVGATPRGCPPSYKRADTGVCPYNTTPEPQPQFEVRNFYYQSLADDLNRILEEHSSVEVRRYLNMNQDEYDVFKRDLEELNSEELPDLNSIYYFKAEPKEALLLFNKLKDFYGVEYIYPHLQKVLTAITTPDLSSQQGYLTASGGIDAVYAWNLGITGKSVHVYDDDNAFNFDHEDLQLDYTAYDEKNNPKGSLVGENSSLAAHLPPEKQPYVSTGIPLYLAIAHGTSVAGIIIASHNNGSGNFGVKGISPDAKLLAGIAPIYRDDKNIFPISKKDTEDDNGFMGSVLVIEHAVTGKDGCEKTTGRLDDPCYGKGQLPAEVVPDEMKYYQTLSAMGITVVEGAGNSGLDIGDPAQYTGKWSVWVNPTTQDSGAILVGASEGANMMKASFSNYSPRLDAYSWGSGIITTSYPYGDAATSPFYWKGAGGPSSQDPVNDKHKFYTNRFGGTSAATAIIGGAVALAQSRFMTLAGNGRMRYIMPKKMREFVRSSGDSQKDATSKNIGVQPKMDRLLKAVDSYWQTISAKHPALKQKTGAINRMSKQDIISMRSDGVGLVCIKYDPDGSSSDPLCSDDLLWPRADQMSVDMDIDGDGLMDLVSWKRGEFKIDLSSRGEIKAYPTDDAGKVLDDNLRLNRENERYGTWDMIIKYNDLNSKWVLPYVKDMDADHRSDLMLYDKEHGRWYIEYMNIDYINGNENYIATWDKTLQYDWKDELNIDPWRSKYSRPAVSDLASRYRHTNKSYYSDGWADISILCSDGYWRVDLGGPNGPDGIWDIKAKYLTDAQLKAAPGWAYQTYVSSAYDDYTKTTDMSSGEMKVESLYVKVPDTISDVGKVLVWRYGIGEVEVFGDDFFEFCRKTGNEKCSNPVQPKYGGNETILLTKTRAVYDDYITILQPGGDITSIKYWPFSNASSTSIAQVPSDCKPLNIGYDLLFQCKNGWLWLNQAMICTKWEIKYGQNRCAASSGPYDLHIPLAYDPTDFVLPGRPYVGGISYADTQKIIQNSLLEDPNIPPPIIIDMPWLE